MQEKALALFESHNLLPVPGQGTDPLTALSLLAATRGDYEQATHFGQQARQRAASRSDRKNLAFAAHGLAAGALAQGDYETARQHAQEALALTEAAGNRWFMPYIYNQLGQINQASARLNEAKNYYRASYALKKELDDPEGMALALSYQGGTQQDLPATILRFGRFYSYDSAHTQSMFQLTQKRSMPIIGSGNVYWDMLNVDDAANAIVKTIEHYEKGIGHTFNVCDDEPVLFQNLINFIAERLEAAKPRHVPVWLAKLLLGSTSVKTLLASIRCKNYAFKEKIGWQPQYPTFRQGIAAEVERWLDSYAEK